MAPLGPILEINNLTILKPSEQLIDEVIRGVKMDKLLELSGIIVPCNWDENDNTISVAISSFDEKEYPIEMDGMGKNLIKHISHAVRVQGQLYQEKNLKDECLRVKLYELLN